MKIWRRPEYKEYKRIIKFLVVGASGVPVNLGVVYISTALIPVEIGIAVRDGLAYMLGILVSIFTNFLLNNAWTFADRVREGAGGSFLARLLKFYAVSILASCVQFGTSMGLSAVMRERGPFDTLISGEYRLYHLIAPLVGIALGVIINFVMNNLWTWGKTKRGG